ncbi:hypothetical protein ACFQXB_08075 [Plastorhodobacter daqingensis]|uniref:Uncharacterized protein n=1 Tax=Plastorhodobacter daqingensis TaxID=1387281 RepID=A0ABW2UHJ6_9RHOB
MRHFLLVPVLGLAVLSGLAPARAATFDDPEWPCIQRKIPHLSLGQVWSGPLPDDNIEGLAREPEIQRLAARLELRRTPIDEAEALIAEFATGADEVRLTALYLATFQRIDRARSSIINGIGRYALKQRALDDQIDARRVELTQLLAADPPDHDRIDAVEQQLDWDTRIFLDRQQSLIYVCETPVILEQRAFALGRIVAAHLPQ